MAFTVSLPQQHPTIARAYVIPNLVPRIQRECANVVLFSQKVHEGSFSNEQAREKAAYILTNYSKVDFIASLKHFTKKALQLNSDHFEIKATEEIGHSGDKVYIVWNKENKSVGVLKVFKEDSENFFPEIFSLKFLKDAEIPAFASPNIEALGKCRLEDKSYFLLCETVAPGCSFMSHYKNCLPIESLEKGMHKCGYSLAKLHHHSSGKIKKIPEDFIKRTREYLEKAIEILTQFPQPGIDVKKLRDLFEFSMKEIESEAIPTAVIHGDTKLENVFYDPQTDTVTWIDPPKLSESIHNSGSPIGIPAKDFNSFVVDIAHQQVQFFLDDHQKVCSKKLITDENISTLLDAFCTGYQEGGGNLPTKKQLDFFSLAGYLYFTAGAKTLDPACSIPEPFKSIKQYRTIKTLKALEVLLKTFF